MHDILKLQQESTQLETLLTEMHKAEKLIADRYADVNFILSEHESNAGGDVKF